MAKGANRLMSPPPRPEASQCVDPASPAGTRTAPVAPCRRPSPRTSRTGWTTRPRPAPRANTSKAPFASHRRSAAATGRSAICGAYTDRMAESAGGGPGGGGQPEGRFVVTSEPLDPGRTAAAVESPDAGAVSIFVGVVRDHNLGRRVRYLGYECYQPLAL